MIPVEVDGMFWPGGEVRRGKLSGDLGGDNFTAGVYGVMVQHAKYPVGYGEFKPLRDIAVPQFYIPENPHRRVTA